MAKRHPKKSGSPSKSKRKAPKKAAGWGSHGAAMKAGMKAGKKSRKGRKLSAEAKRKIGAASRKHWKSITGNGSPQSHIPLAQLKKNHKRLGDTIAIREKNPSLWK